MIVLIHEKVSMAFSKITTVNSEFTEECMLREVRPDALYLYLKTSQVFYDKAKIEVVTFGKHAN